jgi:hypothetical protein
MNLKNTTTRRTLLKSALGLGIALGIGARARALGPTSPFTAFVPWKGLLTSSSGLGFGGVPIQLSVNFGGTTGTLQIGNSVALSVDLGFDPISQLATIKGAGIVISGTAVPTLGGAAKLLSAGYTTSSDSGSAILQRDQSQGVVVPVADGNVASLEILPPDWLGKFVTENGLGGGMRFVVSVPPPTNGLPRYNEIYGTMTLGDLSFATVMTFAPLANTDGSYAFDLIGDTGRAGAPLLSLSGNFFPAQAALTGELQLIGLRGVLDRGRFALSVTRRS